MENENTEKNNNENPTMENADALRADFRAETDGALADAETPKKRGRGRPRKNADTNGGNSQPIAPLQPTAQPLWDENNAGALADLPFLAATYATGFDGFMLDKVERETIARPLAVVLNEFAPAGKYASIIALSSALIVVAGAKYKAFSEYQKKNGQAKG